jgi:hypothetical protein
MADNRFAAALLTIILLSNVDVAIYNNIQNFAEFIQATIANPANCSAVFMVNSVSASLYQAVSAVPFQMDEVNFVSIVIPRMLIIYKIIEAMNVAVL